MKIHFSDLWRWDGTIGRGPYALIGVIGFAIKHNLDRLVASLVFHRRWDLFNYWIPPTRAVRITALPRQDASMLATLLALALPFIWAGVVLTLRRLRAIGLPIWLVVIFFLPFVNLLFFLLLSILPSRWTVAEGDLPPGEPAKPILDRLIPDSAVGSVAMAVLLTLPFELAAVWLGVTVFATYGWSLFVALPFCHGLASVLLYGYHRPRNLGSCILVSLLSPAVLGLVLLAVAIEGVICLIMAWPIAAALSLIGGSIGYLVQLRPRAQRQVPAALMLLILLLPALMGAEYVDPPSPPVFEVRTSIEIGAPPQAVWRQLIAFADLPAPEEWIFRIGVAYPTRARLEGTGVGAIRHCVFSTGAFTEPITVWDEPHLLRFKVTANPPPLEEWTPYSEIHPAHLKGFLVSRQGQFLLTPLPGGRTRLEGTTWYQHHMWPAAYWQLWSDAIIHRIHLRVLNHIKFQAEQSQHS